MYRCLFLFAGPLLSCAVAVSEPRLFVVSAEGGGVTLQCEVSYWLTEPQITFLDDQGNYIPAKYAKREQDASGSFTVNQRITLQRASRSITCRVHEPEFNQTRDIKILIPAACMSSDVKTIAIAVGGVALVTLVALRLAVLLYKRRNKFAEKSSY